MIIVQTGEVNLDELALYLLFLYCIVRKKPSRRTFRALKVCGFPFAKKIVPPFSSKHTERCRRIALIGNISSLPTQLLANFSSPPLSLVRPRDRFTLPPPQPRRQIQQTAPRQELILPRSLLLLLLHPVPTPFPHSPPPPLCAQTSRPIGLFPLPFPSRGERERSGACFPVAFKSAVDLCWGTDGRSDGGSLPPSGPGGRPRQP